jgi:hypothetical protein
MSCLSIYKQRDTEIIPVHYNWLQGISKMVGPFAYLSGHPSCGLGVSGESEAGPRNYWTPGCLGPSSRLQSRS